MLHTLGTSSPIAMNACLRHDPPPSLKVFAAKIPANMLPTMQSIPIRRPTGIFKSNTGGRGCP